MSRKLLKKMLAGRKRKSEYHPKFIIVDGERVPNPDYKIGEICDPVPLQVPVAVRRPKTQRQELLEMINDAVGKGIAEESDIRDELDFDIDEPELLTRYEKNAHVYDLGNEYLKNPPRKKEDGKPSAPQKAGEGEPSSSNKISAGDPENETKLQKTEE